MRLKQPKSNMTADSRACSPELPRRCARSMNTAHRDYSDPMSALREHAHHLNSIRRPRLFRKVFYELMSGGLVWTDETHGSTPREVKNSLRIIFAYRTSLLLGEPRDEFKPYWDQSLELFPRWVGFRPERRTATPRLLETYRRGNVSLKKCLKDMERESDVGSE